MFTCRYLLACHNRTKYGTKPYLMRESLAYRGLLTKIVQFPHNSSIGASQAPEIEVAPSPSSAVAEVQPEETSPGTGF